MGITWDLNFLSTYKGWQQESTGRSHCDKAQCRTRCTASPEMWACPSGRVWCCMSDNASFPRCSTCLQTLVCGKQVFHNRACNKFNSICCQEVTLTWGCYILSLLTELQSHRSWNSETTYSTDPNLHSLSLGVYPQSHTLLRYTTEREKDKV